MIGLQKNSVDLCLINSDIYRAFYEDELEILTNILDGYFVSIEHVGSTAIPGIMAKPIIDIAVGLIDSESFDLITSILEKHGYIYLANRGEITRRIFIKTCDNIRTHHIHVEEYGKQNWINHVEFRNKLLSSTHLKKEYETLKIELSKKYATNREKYTSEKSEFIQKVLYSK